LPGVPVVAPGFDPDPASFAPVLFVVPDRLNPPVDGPLPAAPGDEPAPASFAPVLFEVPDRLPLPELSSAARAAPPKTTMAATARSSAFMSALPMHPPVVRRAPTVWP
jgi:hypothetical protein